MAAQRSGTALAMAAIIVALIVAGVWYASRDRSTPGAQPAPTVIEPLPLGVLGLETMAGDRLLDDGDPVAVGEPVRFRVLVGQAGHLAIARLDRLGGAHLVYPRGRGGQAVLVKPSAQPRDLGQTLERVNGEETLVAVFCRRPFLYSTLKPKLRPGALDAPLLEGCAQVVRKLRGPME